MTNRPEFKTVTDLLQRLQELHVRTRETPLFNPVFQLSLEDDDRSHPPIRSAGGVPGNLPAALDNLVGRDDLLGTVAR